MMEHEPLKDSIIGESLNKLELSRRVSTLSLAKTIALIVVSRVENWADGVPAELVCSEGVRMDLRFFPGNEYNAVAIEIPDLERAVHTGVAQFDGLEIRWKGYKKLGVVKMDESSGEEDAFKLNIARQRLLAQQLRLGCNPRTP